MHVATVDPEAAKPVPLVTIPQGMRSAEIKVTHRGISSCFQATDTVQAGASKACFVLAA
ncbi:hypothetical protein [Streptomyces roseoverticillatus]|uniref:Uncharacterized protein n=1 Tax=Streptomyces roseoverticillatus TaxID=66429 RepID=A0ABV3IVM4_9ACTN